MNAHLVFKKPRIELYVFDAVQIHPYSQLIMKKLDYFLKKIYLMIVWVWEDFIFLGWHIFVNCISSSFAMPRPIRFFLYRLAKMEIYTPSIAAKCFFTGSHVKIGKRSFVNHFCFFDSRIASVVIGNDCEVGMEVMFCATTHRVGPSHHRCGDLVALPITIGDGCWIGARSVILPGVEIGDGCIIGAGAVVVSSCHANGLYAGVPAKRIKDLD